MAKQAVARTCCPGIEMLDQYMRFRSALEGIVYDLKPELLQIPFDDGVRSFFGVRVTKKAITGDTHNPEAFVAWRGPRH